jgi:hypothetical protein
MASVRLLNITPDTPEYLIKKHIASLMDEVCDLSHMFNIKEISEWNTEDYI